MDFVLTNWEHRLNVREQNALRQHSALCHKSLAEFISIWPILRSLVRSEQDLRLIVKAAIESMVGTGITHVELRSTVVGYAAALGVSQIDSIHLVGEIIRSEGAMQGIKSGLILSFDRGLASSGIIHKVAPSLGDLYRNRSIIGIDITGDEEISEHESICMATKEAKRCAIPITFHAGETGKVENIYRAVEHHGAQRIGHATAIWNDRKIVDVLARNGVCVEVCITSNVVTGILSRPEEYPLNSLIAGGVPFVICSDNPALLETSLEKERDIVAKHWGQCFVESSDQASIGHSFL